MPIIIVFFSYYNSLIKCNNKKCKHVKPINRKVALQKYKIINVTVTVKNALDIVTSQPTPVFTLSIIYWFIELSRISLRRVRILKTRERINHKIHFV